MDIVRSFRFIGSRELKQLSEAFDLPRGDFQVLYLHKLTLGYPLPPLVVDGDLLEASGL